MMLRLRCRRIVMLLKVPLLIVSAADAVVISEGSAGDEDADGDASAAKVGSPTGRGKPHPGDPGPLVAESAKPGAQEHVVYFMQGRASDETTSAVTGNENRLVGPPSGQPALRASQLLRRPTVGKVQ